MTHRSLMKITVRIIFFKTDKWQFLKVSLNLTKVKLKLLKKKKLTNCIGGPFKIMPANHRQLCKASKCREHSEKFHVSNHKIHKYKFEKFVQKTILTIIDNNYFIHIKLKCKYLRWIDFKYQIILKVVLKTID